MIVLNIDHFKNYFKSKGITFGFHWQDVEAQAHATAFTVAGILKQDILEDVRRALTKAMENGEHIGKHLTGRRLYGVRFHLAARPDSAPGKGRTDARGCHALEVVRWLAKNKIEPQSAVISITDKALIHATRDIKEHPLPPKFWKTLPQRLKNPKAILFDTTSEQKGNREDKRLSLLWVINLGGKAKKEGKAGKAAIHIDYTTKVRALNGKTNENVTTNMVITGSEIKENNLYTKIYTVIFGDI